jgi:predicted nucleic acid-binding protein
LKIYLDSSVVLAIATPDEPFSAVSKDLISRSNRAGYSMVISLPFLVEFGKLLQSRGTRRAMEILEHIEESSIKIESVSMDYVWRLANRYLKAKVLPKKSMHDMLHYAAASILECKYIASWDTHHFNDCISIFCCIAVIMNKNKLVLHNICLHLRAIAAL